MRRCGTVNPIPRSELRPLDATTRFTNVPQNTTGSARDPRPKSHRVSDLDSLDVTPIPPSFNAGGFDCGETDLTDYLCDGTAAEDEKSGFSRTYLVQSDNELVGYFTVLADSIRLKTKERPGGMQYSTAPAIKLGRMGVHKTFRGHKVGTWILDYVVGMARATSRKIGVRYITLDALPAEQLVAWYGYYGFVQNEG